MLVFLFRECGVSKAVIQDQGHSFGDMGERNVGRVIGVQYCLGGGGEVDGGVSSVNKYA